MNSVSFRFVRVKRDEEICKRPSVREKFSGLMSYELSCCLKYIGTILSSRSCSWAGLTARFYKLIALWRLYMVLSESFMSP